MEDEDEEEEEENLCVCMYGCQTFPGMSRTHTRSLHANIHILGRPRGRISGEFPFFLGRFMTGFVY